MNFHKTFSKKIQIPLAFRVYQPWIEIYYSSGYEKKIKKNLEKFEMIYGSAKIYEIIFQARVWINIFNEISIEFAFDDSE